MRKIFPFIAAWILLMPSVLCADSAETDSTEERLGLFIGATLSSNPDTLGLEIGADVFRGPYVSANAGLILLFHENAEYAFSGFKLGLRVEAPTRIAPFAGIGGLIGFPYVEEEDEAESDLPDYATFFPEVGIHLWVTEYARFTFYYAYNFSSWGRADDFNAIGLNFGLGFEW